MWIDEIELVVQSGRGGDGAISFRHEKCVEFGGPNGGNGGKGGSVIFLAFSGMTSLALLRGKKLLKASPGEKGRTANCTGKTGDDLVVKVPPGTVIRRAEDGSVIADLVSDGDRFMVAEGGRGGRGNQAFATSTNRSPRYREMGEKSRRISIRLEIRLMADVGLVGLPNAGKSTLLSRLSAARPKIADYPFTTVEPQPGIVEHESGSFVMADLPGLIRDAHKGRGLGIRFLKHVERTRIILHLVDATSENPEEDYLTIREELEAYGHGLAEKHAVVVLTKTDALPSKRSTKKCTSAAEEFRISAHSGEGLKDLVRHIAKILAAIPPVEPLRGEHLVADEELPVTVRRDGDVFIVEGDAVDRYLDRRAPDDYAGWRRFWKTLMRWGVADELKRLGVKDRDTVRVGDQELEYMSDE